MTLNQLNKEIKQEMQKRKDYKAMSKLQKTDLLKGLILDGTTDAIKGLNKYGTLQARTLICEFRKLGYEIETRYKIIQTRYCDTRVAEYYLQKLPKGYSNKLKKLVKERYAILAKED